MLSLTMVSKTGRIDSDRFLSREYVEAQEKWEGQAHLVLLTEGKTLHLQKDDDWLYCDTCFVMVA